MGSTLQLLVAVLSLFSAVNAARACGSGVAASSAYQWRVNDARYDGADPSKHNGYATVAVSIIPGTYGAFFECVAQWPEAWAGWYPNGSSLIWSDCIWSGSGPTYDKTVSFAIDWKNTTMYLTHTFNCSNRQGTEALATGVITLGINCTTAADGTKICSQNSTPSKPVITTNIATISLLGANSTCTDNQKRYQSWELEKWFRKYEMDPGSDSGAAAPPTDPGPSFILRSMANSDNFNCTSSGLQKNTFSGTCKPVGAGPVPTTTTTASFLFDTELDMLTITQHWDCGNSVSFDAVGVGYVQSRCDRNGNILTCTSDPLWVGTRPF